MLSRLMVSSLVLVMAMGCSDEEASKGVDEAGAGDRLPGVSVLGQEPSDVRDVRAVKEGAKVGEEVAVYGRLREFTEGYASFILTDRAMRHCAEREGDTCPTPWDYCCEAPTDVAHHSLTVEFRDGDRPRRELLEGWQGLEKLADVVVSGTVVEVSDGNVIVAGEGFFVRSS